MATENTTAFETVRLRAVAGFHPAIELDKRRGMELATRLVNYIDVTGLQLESHIWRIQQSLPGHPEAALTVEIQPNQAAVEMRAPELRLERFESISHEVFGAFYEVFQPELLLSTGAQVSGTIQIDGDAREFLAQRVMSIHDAYLNLFNRPIHLVGLRLFFPPFAQGEGDGPHVTDWHVDVRAESFIPDPSKIFLEATAEWPAPQPWNNDSRSLITRHVSTTLEYLRKKVVQFLRTASHPDQGG